MRICKSNDTEPVRRRDVKAGEVYREKGGSELFLMTTDRRAVSLKCGTLLGDPAPIQELRPVVIVDGCFTYEE